jgi:hypothetical protein
MISSHECLIETAPFPAFSATFEPHAESARRRDHCATTKGGARMTFGSGEIDPSQSSGGATPFRSTTAPPNQVTFSRHELKRILDLYGRKVAAGEWRDYAIDFLKDRAVFSVFRRSSEQALYRIEKNPRLARRQGAYSIISATGLIVRRGHELDPVLRAIDKQLAVVN